jgi:hypothetical protein
MCVLYYMCNKKDILIIYIFNIIYYKYDSLLSPIQCSDLDLRIFASPSYRGTSPHPPETRSPAPRHKKEVKANQCNGNDHVEQSPE